MSVTATGSRPPAASHRLPHRPGMTIRIVVADDEALIRGGIVLLFNHRDFEVVGEAPDGRVAVELARAHHPDVILMDLRMPGADGVAATTELCRAAPDQRPKVLI